MENKKIAVRYQSRGGNTKAVAEVIAKAVGVEAEPIDVPITEPVDILFVGGGVYAWTIDKSLKTYLEKLAPENIKSIAAFSTAGGMSGTGKITAIVRTRGINVCEEPLPVKVYLRNHASLGGKGHITLSEKHLQSIKEFVKQVVK